MHDPDLELLPTELKEALQEFYGIGESIIDKFGAELASVPPPPLIYHYTDDGGLKGIIENGNLWFTDIFNLNDPSELLHGFSKAVEILDQKTRPGLPIHAGFVEIFSDFVKLGGIKKAAHFFTCSFSFAEDDLGQWRAYADNGRGYALGFDTLELEASFVRDPKNNPSTFQITYDDAALVGLFSSILDAGMKLIRLPLGKHLTPQQAKIYMVQLSMRISVLCLHASIYFKHEAYKNEEEYRFLQTFRMDLPAEGIKFRSRPYSLVKFREINWKSAAPNTLRRIVVGPAADFSKAGQFAHDCCKEFYTGPVEIIQSKIPYRAH